MGRFWVYIGTKIHGPVEVPNLRKVAGFNLLTQVCEEGEQTWRIADDVIEIKSYFLAPPRASALPMEVGNTALKIEEAPPLVDANAAPLAKLTAHPDLVEELPPLEAVPDKTNPAKKEASPAGKGAGLRALCEICGYKNPRDVTACMKCGTPITASGSETDVLEEAAIASTTETKKPQTADEILAALSVPSKSEEPEPVTPVLQTRIAPSHGRQIAIGVGAVAILAGSIFGVRAWKIHHAHARAAKAAALAAKAAATQSPPVANPIKSRTAGTRAAKSRNSLMSKAEVATLPGVAHTKRSTPSERARLMAEPVDENPSAYRVISEATPLKHRQSAPLDSPYAQKRRADRTLWTAQQEMAIKQVQRLRIYGGQRTVQRNVDILLLLLRDREYSSAFETGKRPYLYNDLDWAAVAKDGPVYEVRLTLSGGREDDGSPRKPLRFSFNADLERGTVEPGGEDESTRSNTLHAFFDESRIPPEERRPIAKDVEELVMAADPQGSPLALDTVVRSFVSTYNVAALERVANAFNLDTVKKKLKHDPRLGKAFVGQDAPASSNEPAIFGQLDNPASRRTNTNSLPGLESGTTRARPEERNEARSLPAMNAAVGSGGEFRMDSGSGRDRILQARVRSAASPERLWEALTSYDRFKQFVPDVLESSREGQDGNAIIVHAISLSRWMILVFKINLHLRIIERPAQKVIEFERIAGDFETFRGAFEIQSDPNSKQSMLIFHATLAPKGKMPDWVLAAMSRRFILPKLNAMTSRAEAN